MDPQCEIRSHDKWLNIAGIRNGDCVQLFVQNIYAFSY